MRAKPERHHITTGKEKETRDNNYEGKTQKMREDERDGREIDLGCRDAPQNSSIAHILSNNTHLKKYVIKESVNRVKEI